MRRTLSACGVRAREVIRVLGDAPDPARLAEATFAVAVVKNWKRRVGMELGSMYVRAQSAT